MSKCRPGEHTCDDDYCTRCGAPQGAMRDFLEDEQLLDVYPPEVVQKMTPAEMREAIRREKS